MLRTLRVYIYKSNFLAEISKKREYLGALPHLFTPGGPLAPASQAPQTLPPGFITVKAFPEI